MKKGIPWMRGAVLLAAALFAVQSAAHLLWKSADPGGHDSAVWPLAAASRIWPVDARLHFDLASAVRKQAGKTGSTEPEYERRVEVALLRSTRVNPLYYRAYY